MNKYTVVLAGAEQLRVTHVEAENARHAIDYAVVDIARRDFPERQDLDIIDFYDFYHDAAVFEGHHFDTGPSM